MNISTVSYNIEYYIAHDLFTFDSINLSQIFSNNASYIFFIEIKSYVKNIVRDSGKLAL